MNRRELIKSWLELEMVCIQHDGHYTGPQSVSVSWFLDGSDRATKVDIDPPFTDTEVVEVLNELIKEEKMHFSHLQVVEGKVVPYLIVP